MTSAEEAAAAFELRGSVISVQPHPTGHINDAYLVTTDRRRYLLQRLNPSVFADPDAVVANVVAVTAYLRSKAEPTLTIVPARDGTFRWRDHDGTSWRTYEYLEASHPLEVHCPDDAAVVGRAFGRFHRLLAEFDPASLRVSLPGFHDPRRRLAQLERAVATDPCDRLADASELVDTLRAVPIDTSLEDLPVRAAHNDAKAANLLVDDIGGRLPLVVDLDTVMPGSLLWDVGDMVRSSTGTSDESTANVAFDVARFQALVSAWLAEVGHLLSDAEHRAIPRAGLVVTLEQAARFLTDHLLGDVYFRVSRPGENLERARNQVQLLHSMQSGIVSQW